MTACGLHKLSLQVMYNFSDDLKHQFSAILCSEETLHTYIGLGSAHLQLFIALALSVRGSAGAGRQSLKARQEGGSAQQQPGSGGVELRGESYTHDMASMRCG